LADTIANELPVERAASSEAAPRSSHRLAALDALRGIAAVSVVMLHLTHDFQHYFAPKRLASFSWNYGAYGVHLFFLISGFVILMTAEKARSPREFVVSRFSRLYPAYWFAVLWTTALLLVFTMPDAPAMPSLLRRAVVNLTMFQSWLGIGSVDSVYWTLQAEMSFYLILLLLIWRKAVDRTLTVMTTLVALSLIDHWFVPRPLNAVYEYARTLLLLEHAYLFTAGIVIYKMQRGFKARYAVILLLCALCPLTANYFPNSPLHDAPIAVSLAIVVYLAARGTLDWLTSRPLLYLGAISYSLYLTHRWTGLIILKAADNLGVDPNLALVGAFALCLLLAAALTRFVEQPSLRWIRARLAPRRSGNQ